MRRNKMSVLVVALVVPLIAIVASCSQPEAESPAPQEVSAADTAEEAPLAGDETAPATPAAGEAAAEVESPAPAEPAVSLDAGVSAATMDASEDATKAVEEASQPARKPDVHFVPTPQEVVDRMLEIAQVTKDDLVYDLGCGDGRIVVTAAKKYGCQAAGFDIDPRRIKESTDRVRENQVESLVTIRNADIFTLDLTPASVVSLYLLPSLNVRLIPQLQNLKPGSRIVSHDFDMRGVEPDKVEEVTTEDGISHKIYFWTTPLKIDQAAVDQANDLFE